MNAKEILRVAKAKLTPEVWRQGNKNLFHDDDSDANYTCAAMAINRQVIENWPTDANPLEQALKALAQAINPNHSYADDYYGADYADAIIKYNDDPKTTLEMVHAKFDQAMQSLPDEP